ncbi:MAG: AAA family ATPase [Bacteroidales bacterium]|nr:AAA family ATPase [Bacteroidales bacterium]
MSFSDITILYGGDSLSKSTILNIIAQKLNVIRNPKYDFVGGHMQSYVDYCSFETDNNCCNNGFRVSKMITGEEVSGYVIGERLEHTRKFIKAVLRSDREYIMLGMDRDEKDSISDTDNSFMYLAHSIEEEGLYLLDEPEACLSPEMQMSLHKLILNKAKYNNSQFIIATHSPFLLGIPGAKIYNLDAYPASETRFGDLPSIKTYRQFFAEQEHFTREDSTKVKFHPLLSRVAKMVVETQCAQINSIQREFNLGINEATHIMDQLESIGVVSPYDNNTTTRKRQVLICTVEELMNTLQGFGLEI